MVSGEIPTAMMVTSLWSVKLPLLSLPPALVTASMVTTAMIKMMFSTSLSLALVPFLALVALNGMPRTIPTLRTVSAHSVTALSLASAIAPAVVAAALAETAVVALEAVAAALLALGKDTVPVLPAAVMMIALMI
jgi:hypothetical protein